MNAKKQAVNYRQVAHGCFALLASFTFAFGAGWFAKGDRYTPATLPRDYTIPVSVQTPDGITRALQPIRVRTVAGTEAISEDNGEPTWKVWYGSGLVEVTYTEQQPTP